MDEHSKLALITTFCTLPVIIILLFCIWKCCYKDRKFICLWKGQDEELIKPESKTDFLIKRCDQASAREHEDLILQKLERDCSIISHPWGQALDDGQHPVIVFCVISSRIGTDIENAMRGVQGNSPVILVLLHIVLSSLIKGDLSDNEELLDPTMRNRMSGIAHFAFFDGEGLYKCRQNDHGSEKLVSLVNLLSQ